MSGGDVRTDEGCECKCVWGLRDGLCGPSMPECSVCPPTRASHSTVGPHLAMLSCVPASGFSGGFQGCDPSCVISQGGWHPQVTNCHLGTLRRVRQEQPCHQHPSSDNAHHGRPGPLWKVSEASHCLAQILIISPFTNHHSPVKVILGFMGGRDFFLFFLVVLKESILP